MKSKLRSAALPIAVLLAVVLLACSCSQSTGSAVSKPQVKSVVTEGKGYRFESNGWTYLHLEGGPYERGFQSGKLMAKEMERRRSVLSTYLYRSSGLKWDHLASAAESLFASKVEPEYLEEMRGISEGAKAAGVNFSPAEVLGLNGYVELVANWWPNVQSGKLADIEKPSRCSAFVATGAYTKDHRVVMAHNTWGAYPEVQSANVLVDLKPDTGHRIFMQSAPGLIHSMTDFFVTDAPIMGTETTISGFEDFDPNGKPEFSRVRKAMQYAGTLDEFVATMRDGNNGGYANSWLLADPKGGEIMRFEMGLKEEGLQRTRSGYFTGFNAPSDLDLRVLECTDTGYESIKSSTGARRVRLDQLMDTHKGTLDVQGARSVISDHYDVYLKEDLPGDRTVEGRTDMDQRLYSTGRPYFPAGAVDGKVMDSQQALAMTFEARWGSSSGLPFDVAEFLTDNPQYAEMKGTLENRPTQPWAVFKAGLK
ncbi:MAG: C45 family autoproteolytic acyltransferase/hydrolase [Candidatus Geothermincolia bacterium]